MTAVTVPLKPSECLVLEKIITYPGVTSHQLRDRLRNHLSRSQVSLAYCALERKQLIYSQYGPRYISYLYPADEAAGALELSVGWGPRLRASALSSFSS